MRRSLFVLLSLVFLVPFAPLAAQLEGPPEIWFTAPTASSTRHSVNPRIAVEYGAGGACLDDGSGACTPDPGTLVIRRNGQNVTGSFTANEWTAENGTGLYGNVNLTDDSWNTLYARICNAYDCAEATISVYIDASPQTAFVAGALHPSVYDPGSCAAVGVAPGAAFACDALIISHSIPGYVSLGGLHSAGVVYSTRSALARFTIPVSVSTVWDAGATKVTGWFPTGGDSTFWNGADWSGTSGTVSRRIMLARAESTATGGYVGRLLDVVKVRVQTAAAFYETTKTDSVPFYFERDSLTTPIARGWGIAGLSRIYSRAGHMPGGSLIDTLGVLLVRGGGGVAFYKYLSVSGDTVSYGRPAGMFATLKKSNSNSRWVLLSIDGTQQFYSWVTSLGYARLDSIVTPAGVTTIAYRGSGSGSPTTITDPKNYQIRFDYYSGSGVGKLQQICAPAGANERCTTFTYGTSGGNTVVATITDPDGLKDSLGYSGSPHWSAVTSITPRSLGTYTITYHSAIPRPSGVVQPSSSDTVKYLAPQLAGAALTGGTSGNPAASAPADSAWGWVRAPLGPTSYFSADWLGNVLLSKGPNNKVSATTRNANGQPLTASHEGTQLASWTYNGLGAVTSVSPAGGSSTTLTYDAATACGAGTGYPCAPSRSIVTNTPLAPDTTWFYYGSDVLLDSMATGQNPKAAVPIGITRYYYGANARLDSVVDPSGHGRRFTYEATWGNLSQAISDSITKTCTPSCATVLDTLTLGFDVTGRVAWRRRGSAGRKVAVVRDLIGRDTMVVDSAQGGGNAITTKTRFNDAARTVTVIDGNSQSIVFLSDLRGRLLKQTDPAGARDSFAYDGNDRVTSRFTRRSQTIGYTYDSLSRLTKKVIPGDTTKYGYHATYGTLDTVVSLGASVYRVHNALGRLTQEKTIVNGVTRTVKYAYGASGWLDTLTDPWNGAYRFGWDVNNRARTITNPFSEAFSIRHSTEGLVSAIVFPVGTDSLVYDRAHLVRRAGLNGEVGYTRDSITKGFRTITLGGMTQTFTYDGFGRLGSEAQDSATGTYGPASESYSYDAAGNRTGTGYSYAAINAVRGRPAISGDGWAPGDSLVYDAAGNPTWWKNTTTNGYDSLTWDAEDRLIRLRRFSSGGSLQLDVNYAYDGLGRRVKKWGSGTGLNQQLYVWNGWELLAETDLSGNAVRRFTHHPEGLDFPLAQREGIYTRFLHLDGQGNVYLLTAPSTGNRVTEYRYRAWGDRYVTPVGENWTSTLTYKGREEDRETGLVYMRHRYYSPRLERFLNADPIGVAGGLNVYAFAGLDPANLADRMGLCPTCDTIHVVDKAPPSPAEEELFGMWFYDYMNSLINGYDAWSNPFAFASSVPSKKKGGARFGPSTPRNNQGPKPPKVEPNWGQCMANAGASAATVALGLAVHSSGAAYRALAAERTEASWVFASWGVSVGAYMLEFEAAVLASTGATLAVLGGTLIAGGVAGLVVGTAIACM